MDVPAPDERGDSAVPHVEFVGVDKSYDGRNLVVRGLDLAVERGEFLTLLGPSGSGKTTCLMMLAGFEAATAGTILIGENNRLNGVVVSEGDGVCEVDVGGFKVRAMSLGLCPPGARATVVIRPERVAVSPRPGGYRNEIETRIDDMIFLGDHLRVRLKVGDSADFIAKIPNVVGHGAVLPGDTVTIGWAALDCRAPCAVRRRPRSRTSSTWRASRAAGV